MIVKNEEATLAHCLESVKTIVDEMIIVDTGSTDKTIDIARGFGAQVHPFKWCDDFAAARNESLKHCKGDWVLILDGDDAVDPLDYGTIKNACLHPFADAYELIYRNYMYTSAVRTHDIGAVPNKPDNPGKPAYGEGRNLPFYADSTALRLARMFNGLAFSDRIHETLGKSLVSHGKTIKTLDAVIHHYGKLFNDRLAYNAQYYLTLARREADENPTDIMAQFNLLQQALVAGKWDLALEAARANLKLGSFKSAFVLYGAGVALQQLERHIEAIRYFDMLLDQNPDHVLAVLAKGVSSETVGDINAGRELIMKAMEMRPDYMPVHCSLAMLELRLNNFDVARRTILDALKIAPDEPDLYDLLVKIETFRGDQQQAARDAMLGLQNCPNGTKGLWYRLVAVHLLQTGERETAKSMLESGLKAFPDDPSLARIKNLIFG